MTDEAKLDGAKRVRAIAHEVEALRRRFLDEVILPPSQHRRIKRAKIALGNAAKRLDELANSLDPRVADATPEPRTEGGNDGG